MQLGQTQFDTSIAALSKAIISATGIEDISNLVCSFARDITQSKYSYAGYIEQDTGHLVCPNLTRDIWESCRVPEKDFIFEEYCGLWGWVLHNKEAVLVNAVESDDRSTGVPEGHIPIKSFLSVPVLLGDKIVGQIAVANKHEPYCEQEQQALERFAELYALAIERKQSEQDLKLSDERYKAIAETSSDGIITIDDKGTVLYWNSAAEELFGYSAAEVLGKSITLVLPRKVRDDHLQRFSKLAINFDSGFRMKAIEATAQKKDGTEFAIEISTAGWISNSKRYFSSVVRDISRRKEMEEALRTSKAQLEKRVQERTEQIQETNRKLRKEIRERKNVEQALRKSEERFRTVADFTYDWEYWIDPEGTYVYVSPSFERITGYKPEDLMHDAGLLVNIIYPEDRKLFTDHLHNRLQADEVDELQFRIMHWNGDVHWIGHVCQPVFDENGRLIGRRASNRDITEQKRAEEKLKKSTERLGLALEATNDGMWDWNIKTGKVFFSPRYYTMLGYEPNELVASYKTWRKLIHSDDRKNVSSKVLEHLRNQTEQFSVEFRMQTQSHEWKWLLGRGKVVERDARGRAVRMVGTNTDISLRKEAEEALRLSETRYRELFDSSRDAIGIIDLGGRFVGCNPAYAHMLGYAEDELLNLTYRDVTPAKWHSWEQKQIVESQIFKKGYSEVYEKEYISKDGTVFPVELRASLLKDENDKPFAIWVFVRDITDRKRAEENLRRDQASFSSLYSLSGMIEKDEKQIMDYALEAGINITGSQFGYLYLVNEDETALTLHAWSRDVMDACRVPHKQTRYNVEDTGLWGDAIRNRKPVITNDYDDFNPSKKGYPDGHVPIKRHMNIPLEDNGKIVLVAGVANKEAQYDAKDVQQLILLMDGMWRIIQNRKAERFLIESEEKLSGVVNSLPDMVFLIDEQYVIKWMNDVAKDVYGSAAGGKKCYSVLYNSPKVPETCTVKKTLQDGKRHDEDLHMELPDKSLRDFWVTANIAGRHTDGRPRLIVYILRDITEMKTIQSEAVKSAHLASIGELAAGVAHEINNPINGIINYAEIVKEEYSLIGHDPEIPMRIAKEGERVAAIVKNLLSFSRQQKKEVRPVEIAQVLDDALALTAKQLQKDDIILSLGISDDISMVMGSSLELQQVFINIITNARYALSKRLTDRTDEKRLTIQAGNSKHNGGTSVRIVFHDNGTGISNDILERVCDPFFSTKPTGEGTGLGLSISHGIVKDHGGTISIESREDEYTRVIVKLPVFEGD